MQLDTCISFQEDLDLLKGLQGKSIIHENMEKVNTANNSDLIRQNWSDGIDMLAYYHKNYSISSIFQCITLAYTFTLIFENRTKSFFFKLILYTLIDMHKHFHKQIQPDYYNL